MADLTQTAANVRITVNSGTTLVQVGEAVEPGMPGYLKASDSKYWKGVSTTAATANVQGVFVGNGDADDYVLFQTSGNINLGATLVVGESYFVSNTAGKIMPSADVSTGEFVTFLGTASTAALMTLSINASGIARA
tara:strand:+ start:4750 stop:5157 length:408 start_codon:yes stop_codon:yes gene_type:complete